MFKHLYHPLAALAFAGLTAGAAAAEPFDPNPFSRRFDLKPFTAFEGRLGFEFENLSRWEIRENNLDFNDRVDAITDDNWFLQRARFAVKFAPTSWLRTYVQIQDVREINSDRPDIPFLNNAEGDDTVDLRQAWVEFGDPTRSPLNVRIGRQPLAYGDERLVGTFEWNAITRTFDAIRLHWGQKGWWADAFVSTVVVPQRGQFNQSDLFNGNETDRGQVFSGLYYENTEVCPFQATDLYVFHLHENANPRFAQNTLGDTNFFTIGTRWKSKLGAFTPRAKIMDSHGKTVVEELPRPVGYDYTVEFAFQTGNVRGMDLFAFAGHGDVGYTFDHPWLPRIALGYSYGTGDDDPSDRDIQTFQNLFPTNHKFYGQMDLFSWANLHDLEVNFKVAPVRNLTVRADFHVFWLETTEDAWYRANNVTAVRSLNDTARAAGNYAGSEIDFLVTWQVNRHLQFEGGYSHFFAGEYLRDTGPSDDADFGYLQARLWF